MTTILAATWSELSRTQTVYLVDSETGNIYPVNLDRYLAGRRGVGARYKVRATREAAEATAFRILNNRQGN